MTPDDSTAQDNSEPRPLNAEHLRMTEALLFAASEPLEEKALLAFLPEGADVPGLLAELQHRYEKCGVNLIQVAAKWQFRTAPDLAFLLRKEKPEQKRLSRAALETLAIVAYHQPVTRAEIEDIRGVALSKGHHRRADGSRLGSRFAAASARPAAPSPMARRRRFWCSSVSKASAIFREPTS